MREGYYELTSESVAPGHPDKLCDQVSDAVLDEILRQDPQARVACETFATNSLLVVGGEITTRAYVDVSNLAKALLVEIGYTDPAFGMTPQTCTVVNAIGKQSPDIAQGVDTGGAGDQGMMIGYACDETPEHMPLPITLAHKLIRRLTHVRAEKVLPYLGPDGKAQVTVAYLDGRPLKVKAVVLSAQHTVGILDKSGKQITEKARRELIEAVIDPVIGPRLLDKETKIYVNPTGKFVIGGPIGDTGMTGRKIIVDTYGGACPHGGGAFSGKDPTKVDRSAAYMTRYVAKNIVAAGLANRATVSVAYAIGIAEPVSIYVDFHGTALTAAKEEAVAHAVRKVFPLTPRGIINHLNLRRPIYRQTAAFGHLGRSEFTWEQTDKVEELLAAVKMKSKNGTKAQREPAVV